MTTVLGIDPGGRTTGIVVRDGARLLHHAVIVRINVEPVESYALMIARTCDGIRRHGTEGSEGYPVDVVAIESVEPPRWHHNGKASPINPRHIIDTAIVYGALVATFPDAILVPPAGNGSRLLAAYPAELVGPKETKGTGELRHARSAWDIAAAGLTLSRQR